MRRIPLALTLAAAATMVTAIALLIGSFASPASAGGGMDAMSVDTDPTDNTATTLGTRDDCREVSAGDEVTIDVTAAGIPASNPMVAFAFTLGYDETYLSVTAADQELLIASIAGSSVLIAGNAAPDTDGEFKASVADLGPEGTEESGSGVLSRLTVKIADDTPPGGYDLTLTAAGHVDLENAALGPDDLNNSRLAVDVTCASLPTPTPTATPPPAFAKGDVDCDDDVDSVDALKDLRVVAGLSVTQEPGCPVIGSPVASIFGDINCNDAIDSVDALFILRHTAALSVNLPAGCPPIGQ